MILVSIFLALITRYLGTISGCPSDLLKLYCIRKKSDPNPGGSSPTAQGTICHSPSFAGPSEIAIDILRTREPLGEESNQRQKDRPTSFGASLRLRCTKEVGPVGTVPAAGICACHQSRGSLGDKCRDMAVADAASIPGSQKFSTRSVEDLITLFSRGSESPGAPGALYVCLIMSRRSRSYYSSYRTS
jgi:hypothetical protein